MVEWINLVEIKSKSSNFYFSTNSEVKKKVIVNLYVVNMANEFYSLSCKRYIISIKSHDVQLVELRKMHKMHFTVDGQRSPRGR